MESHVISTDVLARSAGDFDVVVEQVGTPPAKR
jgi:hypothetical protein